MILILLLFFITVYIKFGLFISVEILLWTIILFISNFLIGINPSSREIQTIRILSIIVIIVIIWYNSNEIHISTSLIIPLSIDKISYLDDYKSDIIIDNNKTISEKIYLNKIDENISKFLKKLDIDQNYIVNIIFFPDITGLVIGAPQMLLSKPIMINRFSSSTTLHKFINERIEFMIDYYYLDDSILEENYFGPGVMLQYWKFK